MIIMRNMVMALMMAVGLVMVVTAGTLSGFECEIFHAPCPDQMKNPPIVPEPILLLVGLIGLAFMIMGILIPVKNHLKGHKTVSK